MTQQLVRTLLKINIIKITLSRLQSQAASLGIAAVEAIYQNSFFSKPLKNVDTILIVLNYSIHQLSCLYESWPLCVFHDDDVNVLFPVCLLLVQKSDSSLSDFLSDDDVKSSRKVTRTEAPKKAEAVMPQKESNAFDHHQKVTEVKPR